MKTETVIVVGGVALAALLIWRMRPKKKKKKKAASKAPANHWDAIAAAVEVGGDLALGWGAKDSTPDRAQVRYDANVIA